MIGPELPPCVERRRQRRRLQLEDDNRAYRLAGWPERELDADSERWHVLHGIDLHARGLAEEGVCSACLDDYWWPIWFSGRDAAGNVLPDRTPDIGTYVDEAGHRLVALGLADPDSVKTAAEIAADTSRRMMRKRATNG